ncbi:MAG: hypothetical protein WBK78_08105, partial [Syntrophomonadaceae bacterium]
GSNVGLPWASRLLGKKVVGAEEDLIIDPGGTFEGIDRDFLLFLGRLQVFQYGHATGNEKDYSKASQ